MFNSIEKLIDYINSYPLYPSYEPSKLKMLDIINPNWKKTAPQSEEEYLDLLFEIYLLGLEPKKLHRVLDNKPYYFDTNEINKKAESKNNITMPTTFFIVPTIQNLKNNLDKAILADLNSLKKYLVNTYKRRGLPLTVKDWLKLEIDKVDTKIKEILE